MWNVGVGHLAAVASPGQVGPQQATQLRAPSCSGLAAASEVSVT